MSTGWGEIGNRLLYEAKAKGLPLIAQFELTPRCNLQCKMCYVCESSKNKSIIQNELSARKWIELAEQARDAGVLYLLLTGGEVLLRKDFKDIYENISKMGFSVTIYSNATMVTPEIAKWMGRIPPSKYSITLYGASPETYRKVCGYADGFERALNGIDLLLSEGVNIDIKTTMVSGNAHEFEKIAELADKRGVNFSVINYITPRREGFNTDPVGERLSIDELEKLGTRITDYFRSLQKLKNIRKKETGEKHIVDDVDDLLKTDLTKMDLNSAFACAAGNAAFWITWDGRMLPCGLLDNPVTYPLKDGLFPAWSKLRKLCGYTPKCIECQKCPIKEFCVACPAKLKTETGYYDKPAPYLCKLARKTKELKTREMNIV